MSIERVRVMSDTKVGLLIPPPNIVMEEEFNRVLLPKNITVHTTRLKRSTPKLTIETLSEMEKSIEESIFLLNMTNADVIIFGCTSGSLLLGYGWDQKIIQRMRGKTRAAVTTTATSIIAALKRLSLKKIGMITPYIDEINIKEKDFLESHRFTIAFIDSFNISDAREIPKIMGRQILDSITKFNLEHIDGIFISCTNLKTFDVIDEIERKYNLPVVTSNQASLWNALRILGKEEKFDKLGQLLARF